MLHDPRMASVEVRGNDAAAFLHAQLTSDVAGLAPGRVALSAWCNPRGQVRNLFWILRQSGDTAFSLVAPAGEADGLARGLRGFVLRAKVETERAEDPVLGVAGPTAEALVRDLAGGVPAPGWALGSGDRTVMCLPGEPHRFLILGVDPLPARLPDVEWRRLEIEAGIAWLTPESRESFIPQMLNLDRLGAVSFEKGCYPGQEIVARTRYLGRLKRRLFWARTAAGRHPIPGEPIRSGERLAGTIVAAESAAAGDGYHLLAVLRTESVGDRLETEDGRRVFASPEG